MGELAEGFERSEGRVGVEAASPHLEAFTTPVCLCSNSFGGGWVGEDGWWVGCRMACGSIGLLTFRIVRR